jgi:uncharacterized protein YbjT (DUF2867 family)
MKTILVTGATGSLGRAAVAALFTRGFTVRAASRHPQPSSDPAVQALHFDYADPGTHRQALQGADGVLLIAPPLDVESPAKLNPVIDLARELGIGQIVLISALGADVDENAPLRRIERHLMASGAGYTILRPNFFMENFTTGFLAPMVGQGEIYLAAGEGKTSFISAQDIAAVAVEAFSGDHHGRAYNLTGPEALDHGEVALLISRASGRTITYHAIPEEQMLKGAIRNGLPESAAQFMGILYGVVRNGWAAGVTGDVREVTGREPVTFTEFARASSAAWK